ncbi:MAG: hypothetical protein LBF85_01620 [Tannerella sp.]|jgi:hypothetical protein|nr:hypothetical protein [Tannerella sp.]
MKNVTLFFNIASFRLIQGGFFHIRMIYLTSIALICTSGIGMNIACAAAVPVQSVHPRIYITPDKKDAFTIKLQSVAWAKDAYNQLKSNIDPYVDRHQTDPEWIISRMQMYWDTHYERVYVKGNAFLYGKGRAPVPTVKFAGHRDGATDYLMPSLEETQPYMDEKGMYLQNRKKEGQPWEWVHPSKTGRMIGPMNDRILALAADAAFLYWYTDEEKYAVFVSDIFLTYMRGMYYRREPFALEDYSNSHLMGLATFEVILDHLIPYLALCYDFIYDYLAAHRADTEMITEVMKRFADQQILYGVPDNNWNIFQARHVAYIALVLEDDDCYKDGRGRQYYLNEILNHTTIRQFALKEMVSESFDTQTGLWHESATYSMSVCNDMLDVISLIDNAENNRLLDTFPIMRKAVPALVEYLFPNGRVTAFGDARYVPLRSQPFEMLIALYRKYGEQTNEIELTKVLRKMINDGFYHRNEGKSMFSLFFYVDELMDIPPEEATWHHQLSDTYYAPNVSWLIQRNGRDRQHGMAFTLTGAYGNHAHANGISLELYGKGLMIAPESSYGETYGTRDNQEYYARFPAHNTVAVDGISDYGMMRSDYPYRLLACYPGHGERLLPFEKATFARVSMTEPRTDARQERLTGIVRTSETSAYVVDIFRSARNDRKDIKHEYFYHSIGQGIDIAGHDGREMTLVPTQELSSQAGDMKGYDYFSDKKAVSTADDFTALYRIGLQQSPDVSVRMWMKGFPDRTVFTAKAPKSNAFVKGSIPDELLGAPLPTLIVRQQGEAWSRPFVAVYHPYTESEGASVREVEYFGGHEGFTGIKVQSPAGTDYIFNRPDEGAEMVHGDMRFQGVYAVIGETAGGLSYLFMGEGRMIEKGKWRLLSATPGAQASLYRNGDAFELTASSDIQLEMPVPSGNPPIVFAAGNPDKRLRGVMRQGNIYAVSLPAGHYTVK